MYVDTHFLADRYGIGRQEVLVCTDRVRAEYVRAANKLQTAKGYTDRHERRYGARSAPEARTLLRQSWSELEQARSAFFRERDGCMRQIEQAERTLQRHGRTS
jgi:hypothetical protein